MKLLLLFVSISFVSCTSQLNKDVDRVYENRNMVLSVFNKVSVFRTNSSNYIFLNSYKGANKNEYVFAVNNGKLSLFRDNLSFIPDVILGVDKNELNGMTYGKHLTDRLEVYLKKMDSLAVSDISSDFSNKGVDLKIYTKSKGVILYVSNNKKVVNIEWRKYIESMRKLDDNWFYSMNDK